jgi:DNA-binding MarR family transcriptional regulator
VHARVVRAIDRRLRTEHDFSVDQYDVLATLWQAPGRSLRMSELADRVVLSPSRMTRRVEALEKLGYVERRPDPDDGRAVQAHLTPGGLAHMRSMALAHNDIVRGMYLNYLNNSERRLLGEIWLRMLPRP